MMAMVVPQAFALNIVVDDYGAIRFYQGDVLGKNDEKGSSGGQAGSSASYSTQDGSQLRARTEVKQSAPIKTLNYAANQRVELQSDGMDSVRTGVKSSDKKSLISPQAKSGTSSFSKKEDTNSKTVNLSYPASTKSKLSPQDRTDYFKDRYSSRPELQSMNEGDRKTAIEKKHEEYQKYSEKLHEQRQERNEERVEIRNRAEEGQGERFEIQSRNVKAELHGANFAYDQATGEVLLTTPSGEEHILQHLPDQAIERMTESGFFVPEEGDVQIETATDGTVKYKATGKRNKKFLGLFDRQVSTEVILDDLTGEAMETDIAPISPLDRLLNTLSF